MFLFFISFSFLPPFTLFTPFTVIFFFVQGIPCEFINVISKLTLRSFRNKFNYHTTSNKDNIIKIIIITFFTSRITMHHKVTVDYDVRSDEL